MLVATMLVLGLAVPASATDDIPADVCLELKPGAVDETGWAAVLVVVEEVVAERSALFPAPAVEAASPLRLDIHAGHAGTSPGSGASCLEPDSEWTARFGRVFLEDGARQMLAEAPTTPGIDSAVAIEWYAHEARLRTRLDFAGPFDIPNGTCWVDDTLSVVVASGTVSASGEQGLETSPFAESACRRFFDHLPDGGAGEQAVTMLPATVALPEGDSLTFVAEVVEVRDEAVIVAGSLRRE